MSLTNRLMMSSLGRPTPCYNCGRAFCKIYTSTHLSFMPHTCKLDGAGKIAKGELLKHRSLDIGLGRILNRLKYEV